MELPQHPHGFKNCIEVPNETNSSATRFTRDGKQITYKLTVLQEPQRARACGSGAKSSADRRPVDPPPIVELKIYEGPNRERDITYTMSANYFLFATLEQARPMAHPRGTDDKTRLTVLTGTPVAGLVYLDRPSPAGYFIFPDLSVRHEGVYRLSFSLYEELKLPEDEDKAGDLSRPDTSSDAHVTHRLEVKSVPFIVYSAKKFPGLTESTSLSRMVAEQGCRVRIRRDVRMRRRDAKGGDKDWDNYEDDTAQARARMSATPELCGSAHHQLPAPHGFVDANGRPRSASNASHHSLANPLSRRTSIQEMGQSYAQPFGTAPHTPQHVYGQGPSYGFSPSQPFSQPPFAQQQPPMQPPPPQYGSQPYPAPPPMPAPQSTQQSYYGGYSVAPPAAVSSTYAPPEPTTQAQRMSMDYSSSMAADHRRTSSQFSNQSPMAPRSFTPQFGSYPASQSYHQPPPPPPPQHQVYPGHGSQQQHYESYEPYNRPPPLQPVQPPARASGANTPLSARSSFDHRPMAPLPPLQVPAMAGSKIEPSSPATSQPQNAYFTPPTGDKRSYGEVFNNKYQDQPLRQGARPDRFAYGSTTGPEAACDADDDSQPLDGFVLGLSNDLKYRRAGGELATRTLPHL
ncbi:hypothetical protein KC367_g6517 [Hortaea werneckii]|nr:hypothetical protein KC367_g6517 [Hortaea werneckii]